MSNKAAIDIGSNSVQFLIVDSNNEQLFREQYVTALGRGVASDGLFDELAMSDTREALKACLEACKKHSVQDKHIKATATEASRKAKNSKDFYQSVLKDFNLEVEIISGEREAYLSTYGLVKFGSKTTANVLIDIGGASTELTHFQADPFKIIKSISLPLGSVKFKILSEKEGKTAGELFSEYDLSEYKSPSVIGISGTMTSITAMSLGMKEFDEQKVNNITLKPETVDNIAKSLIGKKVEEILSEFPFLGKRAGVVAYGTQIMATLLKILGSKEVITSTKGLVHGSILTIED